MWILRGERAYIPSAGQNQRIAAFGALDYYTGQLSVMLQQKKTSYEFMEFLSWLLGSVYADYHHVYLFMDNCPIHKTQTLMRFYHAHPDRITPIWNAAYAPNLNDIERAWGILKRKSINNYYFGNTDNLEYAIIDAIKAFNAKALKMDSPFNQSLLQAA